MKTIVITGANSGLGLETALKVSKDHDVKVIMGCRNLEKAMTARERIISETGNGCPVVMQLDTSSLASVRAFADQVIAEGDEISALVNNAGISAMGASGTTEDGFELVFETNYLGHFLLTQLLLPHMAKDGRIVSISSDMHNPPGGITWPGADAVAHPEKDDRGKYSYSKLALIYMTHELSRRLQEEGSAVTANAFNPGFMSATNFSKGGGKARDMIVKTTMPDRYGKLEDSSDALAQVLTDPQFAGVTGQYFDRSTNTARSSELSYSDENAAELWEKSLEYCGLK